MELAIGRWLSITPFPVDLTDEAPDPCADNYQDEMERWRAIVCAHRKWVRTPADLVNWMTRDRSTKPRLTQAEIDEINRSNVIP